MPAIPYMPLYVADYLADTSHLGALENGAYLLLLMNYWQRGEPLPASDKHLAVICRMSLEQWKAIKPEIMPFFEEADGKWNHKRVDAELQRFAEKSEKAKVSRAQRGKNDPPTDDQPPSNERATNVEPTFNHTSKGKEGKKELLLAQPRAKVNREPGFEEFWAHCPRKVGKGSARIAYRKAITQTSPETLLAALRVFAAKQLGKEPNFIPHPASWLNAERWLDAELAPPLAGSSAPGIPVFTETPQWAAWTKHRGGREPPETDIRIEGQQVRRGWRFPTEWPPGASQDNVSRETTLKAHAA